MKSVVLTALLMISTPFIAVFLITALEKFSHWCNWVFGLVPVR